MGEKLHEHINLNKINSSSLERMIKGLSNFPLIYRIEFILAESQVLRSCLELVLLSRRARSRFSIHNFNENFIAILFTWDTSKRTSAHKTIRGRSSFVNEFFIREILLKRCSNAFTY